MSRLNEDGNTTSGVLIFLCILVVILGIPSFMFGWPTYKVWSKGMAGKAELAEAEFSRKIAIAEAEAKKEAAAALGDAEVIRATKLAEANEILGKSLQNNDSYLQYLWITEVAAGQSQGDTAVIYLPGSEFMPFAGNLEAGRAVQQAPLLAE